jgi:hypothetical protein
MKKHEIRRGLGNLVAITRGRVAGKTFVPHPRRTIFIETSGRCNLACRFCAYDKVVPGGFMANDTFTGYLDQATSLGFSHIWLTPMLGEVFSDPEINDKFSQLEAHSSVEEFGFYSNFILARPEQIAELRNLTKLNALYISIYGFDEASFELTTRKPAAQFSKLLDNLETLLKLSQDWQPKGGIHFNVRTKVADRPTLESEGKMGDLLRRFVDQARAHVSDDNEFDSWGGTITQQEVDTLGIDLTDGHHLYMHGTCNKVFGEVQIKADGQVHACACRDVDGSLIIGDLKEKPLAELLSFGNAPYRTLIESQMKSKFLPNCRACSSYRSIYDDRSSRHDPDVQGLSYAEAVKLLGS